MSYTILIAEDDSDLSDVLAHLLESRGYKILRASEGVEVFEIATKNKPNLVLLDWNMPYGKGSAVLEMLAEKGVLQELSVLVLSGSAEPGMKELALKLGAKKVIKKPYDNQALLQEIAAALK